MGRGLLVAAFDFSTAHADEFHDWYDLEHIPERQTVPGFGACERWIGDEQPTLSVATYDLDSVDVLRSKARRYRSTEANGGTHRYVAIYHLESPDVTRSTAWKAAVDTPWSARVLPHMRDRIRILTHRYVRGG